MSKEQLREQINAYVMLAKTGRPEVDYEGITNSILDMFTQYSLLERIDELDMIPWKRADKYGINSPYMTKEYLLKRKAELNQKKEDS